MKKKLFIGLFMVILIASLAGDSFSFAVKVNHERAKRGLAPLKVDYNLAGVAKEFARVCADHGSISHDYLTTDEVWALMVENGADNYKSTGEVLSYASIKYADNHDYLLERFMNSWSHREILMDEDAVTIGAGKVTAHGRVYFVAFTGRRYKYE